MSNTTRYNEFISQMNGLVIFMTLREQPFHVSLCEHWGELFKSPSDPSQAIARIDYEQLILRSTILLGATYAEAYLSDTLRAVLKSDLRILKPISGKKIFEWREVIDAKDYGTLEEKMIEHEIRTFTRQSMGEMLDYYKKHMNIILPDQVTAKVGESAKIRNLITHNGAIADDDLANTNPEYHAGKQIMLTPAIHDYGLAIRAIIKSLDEQISCKYKIQ